MELFTILEGKPFMTEFGIVGYSTVMLVKDNGRKILFDCGQRGCALQLKQGLAQAGITPDEVTEVVLSHLHFDHTGNLPLFKNAQIYMSETEWQEANAAPDEWHCKATCSYIRENCRLHFVGEGDCLTDNLVVMELPGHTRGLIGLKCGADTILCSDAIKNRYEMWENIPLMSVDASLSKITADRIRREAKHVYPGHDICLHVEHPINKEPVQLSLHFANGQLQPVVQKI